MWLLAFQLAVVSGANAGNDDGVLIGSEAALSAGAITAVTSDGNALWYNPAGVANVSLDTVDVSGSAFVLRLYRVPHLVRAVSGEVAGGNVTELVSIPSGLTYVRPVADNVRLGYGIFVSETTNVEVRSHLKLQQPTATSEWLVNYAVSQQTYHLGSGLAWRLSDNLRFGVSIFGVYSTASLATQFSGGAVDHVTGTSPGFISESLRASLTIIGLEARTGIQWDVAEDWTLGVSVQSPAFVFHTNTTVDVVTDAAVIAGANSGAIYAPGSADVSEWGFEVATPTRVRAGLAHRWDGGWLSLDVDFQHGLDNETVGANRKPVFNARLGGRVAVTDSVSVGAGLFTDLGAQADAESFADVDLDFFGVTLGLEYRSDHKLDEEEASGRLSFSTSFGLRYAVGLGELGGLEVEFFDPARFDSLVSEPIMDLTVHELGLHLGSALYF